MEKHQTIITRYFENGYTNAIAENMNSKIQRFIMINQGTRDRDFFYFRSANYFS
ncbi:MAG: transposase [Bacteroidetes bacterium]|nr:transposase [Bacteroidota bacterium]